MILMIDNYDSFTYNIVQYCLELGADLKVVRNDEVEVEQIARMAPEKIIISPGPATPNEAGVSLATVERFGGEIPILGICLGHQTIAQVYGGKVVRAKNLMHGKTSVMRVCADSPVFSEIPKNFVATRYHSLVVDQKTLPSAVVPTAYSEDDGEIMALQIKDQPVYGVQFHPESIMSEHGHKLLDNFLKL